MNFQFTKPKNKNQMILVNKKNIKQFKNIFIIKKDFEFSDHFSDQKIYFYFEKDLENLLPQEYEKIVLSVLKKAENVEFYWDISDIKNDILIESLIKKSYFNYEYKYNMKTKQDDVAKENLIVVTNKSKEKMIEKNIIIAQEVNLTRQYQDMPPNIATSEYLADEVKKTTKDIKNIEIKILNKKEINALGMNLFLAVNKGSVFEPRLVEVNYNGNPDSKDKNVIVGKGITFDSGGYNIKPSKHILDMKYDMSGAFIAFGTIKALARMNAKINVSALMLLTDNKIGLNGATPDEVYKSMSGKTVEITDIDAEGRLILADGITYAEKEMQANHIYTIATLTGSVVVALGKYYSGIWTTEDKIFNKILPLSNHNNEKLWRLPFDEIFLTNLKKSPIADLKNCDMSEMSDSNSAAMFLKSFTDKVKTFTHLDIAGTADENGKGKAILVKTLANYFEK